MAEVGRTHVKTFAGRVRWGIALSGLVLVMAAGCAAPVSRTNRPVTVWAADPRTEVLPTSRGPAAGDGVYDAEAGRVSLSAAINETAAFQLAMHTGVSGLKAVDIHVGALRDGAGQDARVTVKVYRAWPVEMATFHPWQRLYRNDPCVARQVYDVLVPAESKTAGLPADLALSTMMVGWVDVAVEKGAEPGRYTGTVQVRSQGKAIWSLELVLEVRGFALPDEPAMPAIMRFDARQLCRRHLSLGGRAYAPVRLSEKAPLAEEAIALIHATARMLNDHGIVGVPTGYEPAMHVDANGEVSLQWEDYDRLVQPLIDGSAFAARIEPAAWPVPLSGEHPAAPKGSNGRARYESLLRQMTRQSAEHFRLRRWDRRAYVEIDPPGGWPEEYVRWQRLIVPALRSGDEGLPRLLRLPPEGLGAYGWYNWPASEDLTESAGILAVPGQFYLYEAGRKRASGEGRRMWLRPDHPPFSPSLRVGGLAMDPAGVAWAAWRLRADGLDLPAQGEWPEGQAVRIGEVGTATDSWLIWPGKEWGVEGPVASVRLKRLRMGLQECKYLYLLGQHGRIHVDELLAGSLVPLAGSLVYGRQQNEGLGEEMQLDAGVWKTGIDLMAEEVNMAVAGMGSDDFAAFTNRIAWRTFLQRTRQVRAWAEPARLYAQQDGSIRMEVPVEILNLKSEAILGKLRWSSLPVSWPIGGQEVEFGPIQPFQRARVMMVAEGPGIGADEAGHATVGITLEAAGSRAMEIEAVVSTAAVLPLVGPVRIDGDLSDWPAGRFNQMSDFRLGGWAEGADRAAERQGSRTCAFIGSDGEMLYIAARMQDPVGQMRIRQSNTVRYDGGLPVGEDLLEILIDPDNGTGGGPERLVHIIIKANGAAVANRGLDIWPPVCQPEPLGSRVTAAARVYEDCWMAEAGIPLSAIKAERGAAAYWGLGVSRLRASTLEYSSWSGSRLSWYHPNGLGNVLVPQGNDGR